MKEKVKDMVMRVRVALDEIAGVDVDSDFMGDLDLEIEQALLTAATELSEELPDVYLMPKTLTEIVDSSSSSSSSDEDFSPGEHIPGSEGTGILFLPTDFLRLVRLRLQGWPQDVREITDANSNEGRMQASTWTRGTPQKPKAVLGAGWPVGGKIRRELKYYTAVSTSSDYDHTIARFSYLPKPEITTESDGKYIEFFLHERAIPLIVYRTCAIIMEGKQNNGLADRFKAMSVLS